MNEPSSRGDPLETTLRRAIVALAGRCSLALLLALQCRGLYAYLATHY